MRRMNLLSDAEIAQCTEYKGFLPFLPIQWALDEVKGRILEIQIARTVNERADASAVGTSPASPRGADVPTGGAMEESRELRPSGPSGSGGSRRRYRSARCDQHRRCGVWSCRASIALNGQA